MIKLYVLINSKRYICYYSHIAITLIVDSTSTHITCTTYSAITYNVAHYSFISFSPSHIHAVLYLRHTSPTHHNEQNVGAARSRGGGELRAPRCQGRTRGESPCCTRGERQAHGRRQGREDRNARGLQLQAGALPGAGVGVGTLNPKSLYCYSMLLAINISIQISSLSFETRASLSSSNTESVDRYSLRLRSMCLRPLFDTMRGWSSCC